MSWKAAKINSLKVNALYIVGMLGKGIIRIRIIKLTFLSTYLDIYKPTQQSYFPVSICIVRTKNIM